MMKKVKINDFYDVDYMNLGGNKNEVLVQHKCV